MVRALVRAFAVGLVVAAGSLPGSTLAPALAATEEPDAGSLLVIMDVSGSMERQDGSGTSLIAGAREAVEGLVDSLPPETQVGLRLYGSEYAGNNESTGCRDTELAVPLGPASQTGAQITRAVGQARPTGFTPIGYSLTEAADDFAPEGARSIILVSDGEDTCGAPEPCAAARQLSNQGIDVRIDTVGLFLEDNTQARRQLECVADATGGTYVPADDADELTEELTQASSRAVQRFQTAGTEIEGGPAETQATPIEANSEYVDDIVNGESRWYAFELEEGQTASLVLTDDGAAEYGCCLVTRLVDPDGDQLDFENGFSQGTATTFRAETREEGVAESGTHLVEVNLDDSTGDEEYGAVEYQFSVTVEGDGAPSESAEPSPSPSAEEPAEEQPVAEAADESGTGLLWTVIAVLGLLVLGLAGALAMMWQRLRRVG